MPTEATFVQPQTMSYMVAIRPQRHMQTSSRSQNNIPTVTATSVHSVASHDKPQMPVCAQQSKRCQIGHTAPVRTNRGAWAGVVWELVCMPADDAGRMPCVRWGHASTRHERCASHRGRGQAELVVAQQPWMSIDNQVCCPTIAVRRATTVAVLTVARHA